MQVQRVLVQTRRASTSIHTQFPFPAHAHPSPHEIFHLPVGASQQDIKARYYDLVRAHHPDSPHNRELAAAVRHARFQALTAAYDALRGRAADPIRAELDRRKRFQDARAREMARRRHAEFAHAQPEFAAEADDGWKDRLIIAAGILSLGVGLAPIFWPGLSVADKMHMAASANLAEARREAREYGHERRLQIRRRVREFKEQEAERKQVAELERTESLKER
ncbi:hypothetical protein WOLCODRAFT_166953 [Wolfiporia cocos MD-104 SS10]|uniref:J domain-containing protein n=1 Tax=Wolfiporia cocos (strain MD-104) TaxID=742152 RepID=A0A2H3J2T8_WOLCO|nr:hypothetical protein WOLCODRAFT_166953 [Wolfiporia cocos MD-104 SS10]